MSFSRSKQFYSDIDKVAPKQPGQNVDAVHITIFNALLVQAQNDHPSDSILQALPKAEGNVLYSDMLVRAGLLMQILQDVESSSTLLMDMV